MTNEASTNNPDLSNRRADLKARIARAQDALNTVNRSELEAAEIVAQLRSIAAGKGTRSARRKAAQDAQRIEAKTAKSRAAARASANAVLIALQGELDDLPGTDDDAH